MKKSLIIVFALSAGFTFAQRGSTTTDKEYEVPVVEKPQGTGRDNTGKTDVKLVVPTTKPGGNGNKNVKAVARTPEEYKASLNGVVHSGFGKAHAPAAKAPANDEEANARISELRSNSKEGLDKAAEKIEIAKNRLEELKAAGQISDADYAKKMKEVEDIEKRKNALESSMN